MEEQLSVSQSHWEVYLVIVGVLGNSYRKAEGMFMFPADI